MSGSLHLNNRSKPSLWKRQILSFISFFGAIMFSVAFFITNDIDGNEIKLAGVDGPVTLTQSDTVINQYTTLAEAAQAKDSIVQVADINDLTAHAALQKGDLILLIQMQGANVNVSQDATFGEVVEYGQAGRYEYAFVSQVVENTIGLTTKLQFDYTVSGKTQVVRVPQYTTLELKSGASITAPAWDGTKGGIVTFTASDTVTLEAGSRIMAAGLGFRGGEYQNFSAWTQTDYYHNETGFGGKKGESIAGSNEDYAEAGYQYGRGAIANGGGGGNGHNSGGGGGANGHSGSKWNGIGHMSGSVTGSAAWALDPDFQLYGGLTTSSGGGRGGYTFSYSNRDALELGPGNDSWSGNSRRNLGGLGGRGLVNDPDERLFFGGGGGAGDGNNNVGGGGGNGGGMVFIIAKAVKGTGEINVSGDPGENTRTSNGRDGPGGGGGGGTAVIKSLSVGALNIIAEGGAGGNQYIENNEAEGPGGGGGGGFISLPSSSSASTSVAPGPGGTSNSLAITEFPSNGSTDGASGNLFTTVYIHYPFVPNPPMRVEFCDIQAEWQGAHARVSWATSSESGVAYFALERSFDGASFEDLNQIVEAMEGTSQGPQLYETTDTEVADMEADRIFYRIRLVDPDGTSSYSPIVELPVLPQELSTHLTLYPNPVQTELAVHWQGIDGKIVYWEIFSLDGRRVLRGQQYTTANFGQLNISVNGLRAGHYTLRVFGNLESVTQAFYKQ
ncbi:MAG: T9SS type A sorting domain-containing protein [Bacteroidota bacterium]